MTVGVTESGVQQASDDEWHHAPSTFACGVFVEGENRRVRLKGIFVEQDSKVRVASVRCELIGDLRNMITGFLKNDRMKPSTGSCNNIGGILARRAWIPLKNGETVLMMHEIAVSGINATKPVRFGLAKLDNGKNQSPRFRKRTISCTGICTNRIVGSSQGGTCSPFAGG